jgi:hypothetical protein
VEFVERCATINQEQHVYTLKKLKQRIRRIWPNRKMNQVLLLYENTRPHSSLRTIKTTTKTEWDALPNPPYRSDIAPAAFHSLTTRRMHPEVAVLLMTSCKAACVRRVPKLQQRVLHNSHTTSHANVEKCVGNEGDFVEK